MTKLLLLAANPNDIQARLQLDQEIHAIDQEIRHAKLGAQFKFEPKLAVRLRDLSEYLENIKPHIVHFSGHGSRSRDGNPSCELIFLDDSGNSCPVSQESIKEIFSILKGNIRCLLLNACNADPLAHALAKEIDCTIAILDEIDDAAAIEFSREFYRHIAAGKDVATAYNLGCTQIPNGQNLVRLHARKADPSKIVFAIEEGARKRYAIYGPFGVIALMGLAIFILFLWQYEAGSRLLTHPLFLTNGGTSLPNFTHTVGSTERSVPSKVAVVAPTVTTWSIATLSDSLTLTAQVDTPLLPPPPPAKSDPLGTPTLPTLPAVKHPNWEVKVEPPVARHYVGSEHEVYVTVVDLNGFLIIGDTVHFQIVDGPHAGLLLTLQTNENGQGVFRYTGNSKGTDIIHIWAGSEQYDDLPKAMKAEIINDWI